jgi:hypothetical protein
MAFATFPYVSVPLPVDNVHPGGSIAYRPVGFATITADTRIPIR